MVGQGVLRECLLDPDVQHVLSIVRAPTGRQHAKLTELVHKDFFELHHRIPVNRLRRLLLLPRRHFLRHVRRKLFPTDL